MASKKEGEYYIRLNLTCCAFFEGRTNDPVHHDGMIFEHVAIAVRHGQKGLYQ